MKVPPTPTELVAALAAIGRDRRVVGVAIEKVAASPQMGVVSAFTFGRSYGQLETAVAAMGWRHTLVLPTRWQKHLSCMSGGDKGVTRAAAARLYPSLRVTHATADALLLAEYARQLFGLDGLG